MGETPKIGKAAGNRGKGRKKGSLNKTTKMAKDAIATAAERLGGVDRLVEWVQEEPDNEKAFWVSIYPKLLPLQVNGPGADGEHIHKIVSEVVYPKDAK